MFGSAVFLATGQEFITFHVIRRLSHKSSAGRVLSQKPLELGTFQGILAKSHSTEVERWKQLSHPVTHIVIVRGPLPLSLLVGDILQWEGRELTVNEIPYDVGGLGHWTEIYCDERRDLYA